MDILKPEFSGNTEERKEQIRDFTKKMLDSFDKKTKNIDITDLNSTLAELFKRGFRGSEEFGNVHINRKTEDTFLDTENKIKFEPKNGDSVYPSHVETFQLNVAGQYNDYTFTCKRRVYYPLFEIWTITDLTVPIWETIEETYQYFLEDALDFIDSNYQGDKEAAKQYVRDYYSRRFSGDTQGLTPEEAESQQVVNVWRHCLDCEDLRFAHNHPEHYEPDPPPTNPVISNAKNECVGVYVDDSIDIPEYMGDAGYPIPLYFDFQEARICIRENWKHDWVNDTTIPFNYEREIYKTGYGEREATFYYNSVNHKCYLIFNNITYSELIRIFSYKYADFVYYFDSYIRKDGKDYVVEKLLTVPVVGLDPNFTADDPYIVSDETLNTKTVELFGHTPSFVYQHIAEYGDEDFSVGVTKWFYTFEEIDFGCPVIPCGLYGLEGVNFDTFAGQNITFATRQGDGAIIDFNFFPFGEYDTHTGLFKKSEQTIQEFSFIRFGCNGAASAGISGSFYWMYLCGEWYEFARKIIGTIDYSLADYDEDYNEWMVANGYATHEQWGYVFNDERYKLHTVQNQCHADIFAAREITAAHIASFFSEEDVTEEAKIAQMILDKYGEYIS